MSNDNDHSLYTIRHYKAQAQNSYNESWRVCMGSRPVSMRFATRLEAERCVMALVEDDQKHGVACER